MKDKLDWTCLTHGKKMSEHLCLYCCMCFKSLTPEECTPDEKGQKWDICQSCYDKEQKALKEKSK